MCASEKAKKAKIIAKKYRMAKANKEVLGVYDLETITGLDDIEDEELVIKNFEDTVKKLSIYPEYGEDMRSLQNIFAPIISAASVTIP